jgi:hypothetical protein
MKKKHPAPLKVPAKVVHLSTGTGKKANLPRKMGTTEQQWELKAERWKGAKKNMDLLQSLRPIFNGIKVEIRVLGDKDLVVVQWNCRSLNEISHNWLMLLMDYVDVFMLQETNMDTAALEKKYRDTPYHVFGHKSRPGPLCGGAAILVRKMGNLEVDPLDASQLRDVDLVCVRLINAKRASETLLLSTAYFHKKTLVTDDALCYLSSVTLPHEPWILGGDFNCHHIDWDAVGRRADLGGKAGGLQQRCRLHIRKGRLDKYTGRHIRSGD